MSITLHKNPEFSRLSVNCVAKLYGMAKPFTYQNRDIIVRQGAEADGLYIMQSGVAKVTVEREDGKATIINLVRPGDMFGEIALLDGGRRMANVVALDTVRVLQLSKSDYLSLLSEHPELAQSLAQYVCRRIRHADMKIGALTPGDWHERVSRQLRELAVADEAGRLVIPSALTQQDIADLIGATRERLSRVLRALCQSGEIVMHGKTMVVHPVPPPERMHACL